MNRIVCIVAALQRSPARAVASHPAAAAPSRRRAAAAAAEPRTAFVIAGAA